MFWFLIRQRKVSGRMSRSTSSCKRFGHVAVRKSSRTKLSDPEPKTIIRPARENGKRVRLNIGGKIFETYMSTLTSKEGSIFRLDGISNLFDLKRNEYYFERDTKSFEAILVYMQCGILEKPEKVPYKIFIEELQYFGFHEIAIKMYTEKCVAFHKKKLDMKHVASIRNYLWHVFEYPRINRLSKILTLFQSIIILISTVLVAVSSLPSLHDNSTYISIYHKVEFACIAWYTSETFVRFVTCTDKKAFIRNPLNITDVLSFLLVYILKYTSDGRHIFLPSLLRLLRITRLIPAFGPDTFVRIFDTTMLTLVSSVKEFTTFSSLLVFMLMLFACLLYSVENGESYYNENLSSVPRSIWFCVVTITSVGYGDITPTSFGGRLVTISMFGATILILSLPVPIIINNFMRTNEMLKTDLTVEDFIFNPAKSDEVKRTLFHLNKIAKISFSKFATETQDGGSSLDKSLPSSKVDIKRFSVEDSSTSINIKDKVEILDEGATLASSLKKGLEEETSFTNNLKVIEEEETALVGSLIEKHADETIRVIVLNETLEGNFPSLTCADEAHKEEETSLLNNET